MSWSIHTIGSKGANSMPIHDMRFALCLQRLTNWLQYAYVEKRTLTCRLSRNSSINFYVPGYNGKGGSNSTSTKSKIDFPSELLLPLRPFSQAKMCFIWRWPFIFMVIVIAVLQVVSPIWQARQIPLIIQSGWWKFFALNFRVLKSEIVQYAHKCLEHRKYVKKVYKLWKSHF